MFRFLVMIFLLSGWNRFPENPVLIPGWDTGIMLNDPSVLFDEKDQKWKMWMGRAWDSEENYVLSGIGYAESEDGRFWKMKTVALAPAATAEAWDHSNSEMPSVVINPDPAALPARRYLMWYAGANGKQRKVGEGFSFYQIGLAFSEDGKRFQRLPAAESPHSEEGLILKITDVFPEMENLDAGAISDPEVVFSDGLFSMWFTVVALDKEGNVLASGICRAKSTDGIRWKMSGNNPLASLSRPENSSGPSNPTVVWNSAKKLFEMWYTDDTPDEEALLRDPHLTVGYWYAYSADGEIWANSYYEGRNLIPDPAQEPENQGITSGADILMKDGNYYLFYGAWGTKQRPEGWPEEYLWAINAAEKKDE